MSWSRGIISSIASLRTEGRAWDEARSLVRRLGWDGVERVITCCSSILLQEATVYLFSPSFNENLLILRGDFNPRKNGSKEVYQDTWPLCAVLPALAVRSSDSSAFSSLTSCTFQLVCKWPCPPVLVLVLLISWVVRFFSPSLIGAKFLRSLRSTI